eukprot:15364469-Ditylum_brightwellii.AAC.1
MRSSLSFRRKGHYSKNGIDNEKDDNVECDIDEGFSLPVDECNEGNEWKKLLIKERDIGSDESLSDSLEMVDDEQTSSNIPERGKGMNEQLVMRYGLLDPYTVVNPPMPPPPLGTKEQWIEAYQHEEEEDLKHLNA